MRILRSISPTSGHPSEPSSWFHRCVEDAAEATNPVRPSSRHSTRTLRRFDWPRRTDIVSLPKTNWRIGLLVGCLPSGGWHDWSFQIVMNCVPRPKRLGSGPGWKPIWWNPWNFEVPAPASSRSSRDDFAIRSSSMPQRPTPFMEPFPGLEMPDSSIERTGLPSTWTPLPSCRGTEETNPLRIEALPPLTAAMTVLE